MGPRRRSTYGCCTTSTRCCTGCCACVAKGGTISASRSWYQVPVLADMTVYLYSGLWGSGDTCWTTTCSPLPNVSTPLTTMSAATVTVIPTGISAMTATLSGEKPVSYGIPHMPPPTPISYHESGPVSYTHLRAHETRHDLVCRLLLEK